MVGENLFFEQAPNIIINQKQNDYGWVSTGVFWKGYGGQKITCYYKQNDQNGVE